ncbi:hypothetical protein AYI78_13905 [Shewanella algae]|nr:hypothetical protein AYI78_13905 [Shewanella algae]TVO86566.1 hypothetical protein AYI76_06195 [Shewanella algae]TVO94436.1 hypothetical protein AYI79_13905 [Shewanella algae]
MPGKPYKTLKGVKPSKPGLSAGEARPILNETRNAKAFKRDSKGGKKSTCIAGGFEQPPRRGLKESPIQTKLDLTV